MQHGSMVSGKLLCSHTALARYLRRSEIHGCIHTSYIHSYTHERQARVYRSRRVRGTNSHCLIPGVWKAKGTCMQARGLQRRAAAAAPSRLKWPKSKKPSPSTHSMYFGNKIPRLTKPLPHLDLYLDLHISRLLLPFSLPLQIYIGIGICICTSRSHPDAAPSANHLCTASSKGKGLSDPSSNARRVT
jgi:hypothetical protein